MAAVADDNNLNKLLEDALEDLLLEEKEPDLVAPSVERAGKPNIDESLKKITKVNEDAQRKLDQEAKSKQELDASKSPQNPSTTTGPTSSKKQNAKRKAGSSSTAKGSGGNPQLPFAPSTSPGSSSTKVIDEEEMNRFFASMTEKLNSELPKIDPSEAQARISESVPQIFDLMQNLLSKELLYPALKDLSPKFEEWLEKNLATLSKDDRRRYKKQLSKIHEIIEVFDDESLEDQQRFEKNLELMEQMQSLGAPPEELTVPDGMSKCSIM